MAALVLGGGTRNGFLSDVILQLLSIPLLLIAVWHMWDLPPGNSPRRALFFCAAVLLVPLLQLIPLPPQIWTHLPNRGAEAETFALLGRKLPWMPISVAPSATWLSAISLVVPISVFLGTLLLGHRNRRKLSLAVLGVGLVSVFLGLSQVAQGPSSSLRFFEFSNTSEAVGFFANRNHYAALLYALTLFAAAWAADVALRGGSANARTRFESARIIALLATFTCLVVLVGAQAMARSRGGLGLTIVALLGAFALGFADRRSASGVTLAKIIIASVCLAAMFATQFALYRIMERFASDPLQDARITFARITFQAAKSFMPFGSGMGTFVPVYAQFEKPVDVLANTFANRAHNDFLELWLETGAAGLILIGVFLAWLITRSIAVWRASPEHTPDIDAALMRAASLVVALLTVHSLLDYPLRTGALMAVFAFACALLVPPPASHDAALAADEDENEQRVERPWSPRTAVPQTTHAQQPDVAEPTPARPIERWGRNVDWPEAWRNASQPRRDKDDN